MGETLSWRLSDGPPDVEHPKGKDRQRPAAEPSEHPPNLPGELRRATQLNPEGDTDGGPPLDAGEQAAFEFLARCANATERGDPLAGAAERGGYVRGERDGA